MAGWNSEAGPLTTVPLFLGTVATVDGFQIPFFSSPIASWVLKLHICSMQVWCTQAVGWLLVTSLPKFPFSLFPSLLLPALPLICFICEQLSPQWFWFHNAFWHLNPMFLVTCLSVYVWKVNVKIKHFSWNLHLF